jgi:hypothetical protein
MKWIKDLPTEPGWYWFYDEDQGGWPQIIPVEVTKRSTGLWVTYGERGMALTVGNFWKTYFHMKLEKPGLPTKEDHES